ncbi:hypothetical protein OAS39_00040 [Pirellulales bacterium]|nr:hypothetical protein [Pirellulales bacterium]
MKTFAKIIPRVIVSLVIVSFGFGTYCTFASGAARFEPLGFLGSHGAIYSQGAGVSDDGTVVAGFSGGSIDGAQPYRWTAAGGMEALEGTTPGDVPISHVLGISGDGNVVFGRLQDSKVWRWTEAAGYELTGYTGYPKAVSYDGTVWAILPSHDVNAEGTIWVGSGISPFGGNEAYRELLLEGGFIVRQWLGDLPGGTHNSTAFRTNSAGDVVAGVSVYGQGVNQIGQSINLRKPFLWTEANGIFGVGDWEHVEDDGSTTVSDSGQVIGGSGYPEVQSSETTQFRWTLRTGMVSLDELLLDQGIDIAAMGWSDLAGLNAMSANGRIFVGTGRNPDGNSEAWLIELDIPGDSDGNGPVNGRDVLAWQRGGASAEVLQDWMGNYWSPHMPLPGGTAAAVVPEPGFGLVLVAFLLVGLRRH